MLEPFSALLNFKSKILISFSNDEILIFLNLQKVEFDLPLNTNSMYHVVGIIKGKSSFTLHNIENVFHLVK